MLFLAERKLAVPMFAIMSCRSAQNSSKHSSFTLNRPSRKRRTGQIRSHEAIPAAL